MTIYIENFVTVVLITFNRKNYLKESIDGIISQNLDNFELYIIDNGSDSESEIIEIVKPYLTTNIYFIRHEINNRAVFNEAFNIGKGKYLIITHDDDIMSNNMLTEQLLYFKKYVDVVAVSCTANLIDHNSHSLGQLSHINSQDLIFKKYDYIYSFLSGNFSLMTPSIMLDRIFFNTNDLRFCFESGPACDNYLWLCLNLLDVKIIHSNKILYQYRVHPKQDGFINSNIMEIKMLPFLYKKLLADSATINNSDILNLCKKNFSYNILKFFSRQKLPNNFINNEIFENYRLMHNIDKSKYAISYILFIYLYFKIYLFRIFIRTYHFAKFFK